MYNEKLTAPSTKQLDDAFCHLRSALANRNPQTRKALEVIGVALFNPLRGRSESSGQPLQPLIRDAMGCDRFKENQIVSHLLKHGGIDMNALACMPFSVEDREQFAQLIGYSLDGFGELSYVTDATFEAAVSSRTTV